MVHASSLPFHHHLMGSVESCHHNGEMPFGLLPPYIWNTPMLLACKYKSGAREPSARGACDLAGRPSSCMHGKGVRTAADAGPIADSDPHALPLRCPVGMHAHADTGSMGLSAGKPVCPDRQN